MSRDAAIAAAAAYFDDGRFFADLERRVAIPSTSQEPERRAALDAYLADEMAPSLEGLGFRSRVFDNPVEGAGPLLVAERIEGAARSASTPSCSSRPARRSDRRACTRSARRTASVSPPTCSSPPTARGSGPISRRSPLRFGTMLKCTASCSAV